MGGVESIGKDKHQMEEYCEQQGFLGWLVFFLKVFSVDNEIHQLWLVNSKRYLTSAKNNLGIDEAVEYLVTRVIQNRIRINTKPAPKPAPVILKVDDSPPAPHEEQSCWAC